MSAELEAAKLKLIHQKLVDRYLEAAGNADEELILLIDSQDSKLVNTYANLGSPGYKEHPIFLRNHWVHEASAEKTDLGYWPWVVKRVNEESKYMLLNGEMRLKEEVRSPVSTARPLGRALSPSMFDTIAAGAVGSGAPAGRYTL